MMTIAREKATKWNWSSILDTVTYAFQPIVSVHNGICHGYEALLRNVNRADFESIQDFFDCAAEDKVLYRVDMKLREKAIVDFMKLEHHAKTKLFFNLDNRVFDDPEHEPAEMKNLAEAHGLSPTAICLELSERHEYKCGEEKKRAIDGYKAHLFQVAIDDYGAGFSGLQTLYFSEPNYIKIDRFFITNISTDSRKKLFVSNTVNIAHYLGMQVVAEGIESAQEYYICKEIGCDLVQGHFIQQPTRLGELYPVYGNIQELASKDRRRRESDHDLVRQQMEVLEPLALTASLPQVAGYFSKHTDVSFIVVVNHLNEPVGIVREKSLKKLAYSYFGPDLMRNRSVVHSLPEFIVQCPSVSIDTKAEKILEMFSLNENQEGLVVTKDSKYVGFLTAQSLLKVLHEKRLFLARDQNPLSKLPGNHVIYEYLADTLVATGSSFVLTYLDFDNFKPFNDRYGFRAGDRVILMFVDLLKQYFDRREECFVGHIGGDDFFIGMKDLEFAAVHSTVKELIRTFASEMWKFYDTSDRQNGFIFSRDRNEQKRKFPFMTLSAAMLSLPANRPPYSQENISELIAQLKTGAKMAPDKICAASCCSPVTKKGILPFA